MSEHADFERRVLTHPDAGYNLARWLTHDARDAEDVVQDACLRAMKYVTALHGEDGRARFLTIVALRRPGATRPSPSDRQFPRQRRLRAIDRPAAPA